MTMYVLEHRVLRGTVKGRRQRWEQYAVCGQRAPLERVLMGLGKRVARPANHSRRTYIQPCRMKRGLWVPVSRH